MFDIARQDATRWAWLGVAAIGAAMVGLFLVLPTGSLEQSVVYDALGLAAVGAALFAIRLHRPASWLPWLILALGQLSFVVGDVIWTIYAVQGEDPFPSAADAAYLLGYPLLALGLGIAIRQRVSGGDRAGLLDGAILATGAVVVWWTFVLGPVVAVSDPDPTSFIVSTAYPIGDLLLIGMALGLLMTPGARSASFRLLVANLFLLLIGDLVFGLQTADETYVDGGLLDTVWLAAYVVFAMAAVHPSMGRVFEPKPIAVALLGPVRIALLGAAMLIGPALLAADHASESSVIGVVAVATAVLSVLVLVRLAGMVGHLSRDIERRTALEAQLSFQALHDPLTGLANRRRFIAAVGDALTAGRGAAVLFLDLDDFKDVNDDLGHDAGDALLSAVGQRIVGAIRPDDLGCRIGGDEFAILLPATSRIEDAEGVAQRLLDALSAEVQIEGRSLAIKASIGAAVAEAGETLAVDELLRRADVAMYHAKAQGKDRLANYAPGMDVGQATTARRHARAPHPAPSA